jgi:hypothetical protein
MGALTPQAFLKILPRDPRKEDPAWNVHIQNKMTLVFSRDSKRAFGVWTLVPLMY